MKNINQIKAILFDFDDTIAYTSIVSKKNLEKIYFEYFPKNNLGDFLVFKEKIK